jgi:predicted SprT family Zn-dependent metalloprotease
MTRATAATPPLSPAELHALWSRFNRVYFDNALRPIPIEWSRRLTASAGMFVSHQGPRARGGERGAAHRLIRLSLPLLADEPHREIAGTLAHEMIHQWQFDRLRRRPNHGPDFRRIMDAMNRDGLGITVRHSLDEAVDRLVRYRWQCEQCGRDYRRQRNTIRPGRHRCGACWGTLHEVAVAPPARLPKPRRAPAYAANVQLLLFS